MARTLITMPASAKRDEVIEIRVLIQHPMETGYRRSNEGAMLARNLIRQFQCRFEGADGKSEDIFSAKLYAAIAANPYLAFHCKVATSGTLVFIWQGDNGFTQIERRAVNVQ